MQTFLKESTTFGLFGYDGRTAVHHSFGLLFTVGNIVSEYKRHGGQNKWTRERERAKEFVSQPSNNLNLKKRKKNNLVISLTQDNTEHSFTEDVFCFFHQDVKCPIEPRQMYIQIKWKKLEKEGRPGSSERRIRKCLPLTSSSSIVVLLSVDSLTLEPSLFLLMMLRPEINKITTFVFN